MAEIKAEKIELEGRKKEVPNKSRVPLEEQIKVVAQVKREVNVAQGGRLLYLTISGSDLYGFPSVDSDVDYRGSFQTATNNLLGLKGVRDVIEMKPDIVLFEIEKELNLAIKGNCNVLEHLNATPIYSTPEFLEMRELINDNLTKNGIYNSYRGMAMFNYKKFILKGKKRYKKYLYVFRGLMGGIYALETGRIQPNINELNRYFKIKEIQHLVELKRAGAEESEAEDLVISGRLDELIPPLIERIDKAYMNSNLPERLERQEFERINRWLIELRRDFMD